MVAGILLSLVAQDFSAEAEQSVKKLRVAPGLKVELFAAEPQAVNIVSFAIDDRMRFYVTETHRRHTSVYEVWDLPAWQDEDLAAKTVDDRVALYRKHLGAAADRLAVESERIRLLEDRSGRGRADVATTYAEGFNSLAEGLGSGVLARGDEVWFACAPNLWRLKAGERTLLHSGFGVHMGSGAHDLHGLCFGPDGKIYFSMGDRGLNVGAFALPDTGAVLRSNPDGSELEVFATGLRNPEQLAFDALGNLWTGDNNSDFGDKARWCWVLEGGDTGWIFGFQHNVLRSPWMLERLWDLDAGRTAPSLVPPVGHIGHGPAGIAFYGGTGLPAEYDDHFFMCDFPGGVRSLAVRPKGAGYELVDEKEFLWEMWPTDVEVGPDGAVYVSDWVQGWAKPGKGRIFKVYDPTRIKDRSVVTTRTLLEGGMAGKTPQELREEYLGHPNQRVRLAAQVELVALREDRSLAWAASHLSRLGRLHAIWGLGQLRKTEPLLPLLGDQDPEVRAQAAKVLGDCREPKAFDQLLGLLNDQSLRVRLFAAMALGKLKKREAVAPLFDMLRANEDPFLRHAGVMGLVWIGDVEAILKEDSLAALLALRRLGRPEVARFLDRPGMELEAARAIHDVPIAAAMPRLAEKITKDCPESILSRVLNANFHLGRAKDLGAFAARGDRPEAMRAEALRMLAEWARPSGRDRVLGAWRPIEPRNPAPAREALAAIDHVPGSLRIEFLQAEVALRDPRAGAALASALEDPEEGYRREAIRLAVQSDVPNKAALLARLSTETNPMGIRQQAIASMGTVDGTEPRLVELLDQLLEGKLPAPLHLDLLEAAAGRASKDVQDRLARVEAMRRKEDPLAAWREVLEGGDPKAGRAVFFERMDVACVRCHTIKDKGGAVGPPLTKIGGEKTREYLLESILFPNKEIAKGYGQEAFRLMSDDVVVGRVESESQTEVVLLLPDGQRRTIAKRDVRARKAALSAMPEDISKSLSKRNLRDLVAFLSGLK